MTSTAAPTTIPVADGEMSARMWLPPAGQGPAILVFQEIFGVSPYLERRAEDLAALGYVVLAPEFFWRLGVAGVPHGPDMLEQGVALSQRFDWAAGVADGIAAVEWLVARQEVTGPVGLVGFCFGGGLAFNVAASTEPAVLVSYYLSARPGLLELAPRVTAPSIHHFGQADSYLDAATVERIRVAVAGPDVEFYTYPGADHAFDNPDFVNHHAEASEIAWGLTTKFLRKYLPA